MTLYFIVSLLPLVGLVVGVYKREQPAFWRKSGAVVLAWLILAGAAWYVTHPFLHGTAIGTGEAYNYSLSTADAVSQFRAGWFPVLAGQTEYAFNGRIHPLRTAPLLSYLAGLVDLLTFRQLSFWAIQNLVIALSLLGGAFSAFFGLRQILSDKVYGPALLALAYLLCPAVLAAAYSMDLYMTIVALPFVPLVIAGSVRTLSPERSISAYFAIGLGLAAAWLAHPPVALWLTLSVIVFHLGRILVGRFSLQEIPLVAGAGLLAGLLSLFVFVSTLSITNYTSMDAGKASEAVLASVQHAFAASLQPISPTADQLGDFQWGYGHWALFGLVVGVALVRRKRDPLLLLGIVILLLILTTPVPYITPWIWDHVPESLISITSQWPMQRLYLVACVWTLFAVAILLPDLRPLLQRRGLRFVALSFVTVALIWTGLQSWQFVRRGEKIQREKESLSEDLHRSENINLTVTSYAFFRPPPSFIHAVMDPQMELRLLQRGTADELATNWTPPAADSIESQGTLWSTNSTADTFVFEPQFALKPNTKYRLDFSFLVPPAEGTLRVLGRHLLRGYPLPQAGNENGFGMLPSNRHGLTLWTTDPSGETVHLELIGTRGELFPGTPAFADYSLSRIDEAQLPMHVVSIFPLRVEVTSPSPAYLETPRMFIEGYKAWVNGKEERVIRSPAGRVMVPVPAGHSATKLSYKGTFWLRTAFWISFAGWCGVFVGVALSSCFPTRFGQISTYLDAVASRYINWHVCLILAIATACGGACLYYGSRYLNQAGPIRMKVVLPRGQKGRSHPLITAGRPGAGTFVYVVYQDETHIRIGFDAWAKNAGQTEPIEIDYFVDHEFTISMPAFYPEGHWKTKSDKKDELEWLRQNVVVAVDGRVVLNQNAYPFPSTSAETTVGENRIGGSTTEPKFSGTILETNRVNPEKLNSSNR